MRAQNRVGFGAFSGITTVTCDTLPGPMPSPTLVQTNPQNISVSWTALVANGGDAPYFYQVQWWDHTIATPAWVNLNTYNSATDPIFTYTHVKGSIFSTTVNQQYRILARNGVGWNTGTSATLTVVTDKAPTSMTALTASVVNPKNITITWPALTNSTNGGDLPYYYQIEWYNNEIASPAWEVVSTEATGPWLLTFTHVRSTIFPSNSNQQYRALPKNGIGFGNTYSYLSTTADTEPSSVNTPTTTSIDPKVIKIQWVDVTTPALIGRDAIAFYEVSWDQGLGPSYAYNWAVLNSESEGFYLTYTHTKPTIFTPNAYFYYRIRPKNGVGFGPYSTNLQVQADTYPLQMNPPTLHSTEPTLIAINWTSITDDSYTGRDAIIYYEVQYKANSGDSWAALTTNDGSLKYSYEHSMPQKFAPNTNVYYRLCVQNGVGMGACSTELTVLTDDYPTFMNEPVITDANIHPTNIVLTWTGISTDSYTGRDPIIFYGVEWDQGTNTWINLTTGTEGLILTYTHTCPSGCIFQNNTVFKYRLYAKNNVGSGAYSTEKSITTDNTPVKINPPSSTSVLYNSISLTWTASTDAADTGGDPIIYYYVDFFHRPCYDDDANDCVAEPVSSGAWEEISTEAVQGTTTTFTHSTATHFYRDQNFQYRICGKNGVGLGACSSELIVQTLTVPQQMAPPINNTILYNKIEIKWVPVTDDTASGRSPVLSYNVQWDNYLYYDASFDLNSWVTLGAVSQNAAEPYLIFSHVVSPHFDGFKKVNYRVQAVNGVGKGQWSDPLELITDDVPQKMTIPACNEITDITSHSIKLTWTALPLDQIGGDEVQYYRLEWDGGNSMLTSTDVWTEITSSSSGVAYEFTHSSGTNSFANNTVFRYRLKAMNGVGYGPYSDELSVTSDRTPLQMAVPTHGTVTPSSIIVNWVLLTLYDDIGRDPITNYKVQYRAAVTDSWTDLTTTDSTTTTYTHNLATGSVFPANTDRSDYNVQYRVLGCNQVGWGIESLELSVVTDTFPRQMDQVTIDGDITPLQFKIDWARLTTDDADTGRDPVINYKLQWQENGASEWITLLDGLETDFTFTVSTGFTINTYYNIRVAAINSVGMGQYSTPLQILTDNVPVRMNDPVEDSSTNANYIQVKWDAITDAVDTGRDDIIYYKLEWDAGTAGTTWTELTTPGTIVYTYSQTTDIDLIQNGTSYKYKITPENRAGFGASSITLTIIPSSPPDKMSAPVASISGSLTSVKISWTLPQTNGAAVSSYLIYFKAASPADTFYLELENCDGSNPTIVSQRYCNIPMTVFRAAPFNLARSAAINVTINAANLKGYNISNSSYGSGATVETEPNTPSTPTRENSQTNSVKITTKWNTIYDYTSSAGGSTCQILSYHLQRDQGNNTDNSTADIWTDIKGLSPLNTQTSYTTTVGIVGGTTYKVRVRALNKYGYSSWSSVANIRAACAPNAPSIVTTTNSSLQIKITWDEPFNNGLDITAYKIELMKKSGSWLASPECNGADATVVATRTCYVYFTTFRQSSSYNYVYNDVPSVRVFAWNLEGWGSSKQNSGGAAIQTEPAAPSFLVTNDPANTNDLQIKLSWTDMTDSATWKGYKIHAYELHWQDKDGTFSYEMLYTDNQPYVLTYTHKNMGTTPDVGDTPYATQAIVGGTRYKFKYKAVNIHGAGPFSGESLFYASTIPDKLDPPTTSLLNSTVTISWLPTPNDHKQTVTAYRIKIKNKAGTFVEDTAICSGIKAAVVASLKCSASMLLFTNNLNLAIDDLIVAQVEAQNVMGYSIASNPNTEGITAKKLPQTAITGLSRGASTAKNQIELNWNGISVNTDTGGQPVDYIVYYDKATGGSSWYTWTASTTNLTDWTDVGFTTGKAYQFKVAAFNDFGIGPQSAPFTIWAAIAPSGLNEPSTSLNLLTYVEEDDVVVIDWNPPADDGGLTVSYKIEVKQPGNIWTEVDYPNECSEKGTITNYFIPQATTVNAATQCTMLVSKLKSKYGLQIGDTVVARITAYQVVGSVSTAATGSGTAIIPYPPCFRTTFPRVLGGTNAATAMMAMDIDTLGNIVVGGTTQDSGLLSKTSTQSLPFALYIAKGNYYAWGKYIETTDGAAATLFQSVLDITFRFDGQKIAMALERTGYTMGYVIVVLNSDGSLYGAFRESALTKAKVNVTGMMFDSSNIITAALDISQDGTDQKRSAAIIRFSVANAAAASISPALYITGGAAGKISQGVNIMRIKSDPAMFYATALIQDGSQNRRSLLAKITASSGAVSKYFQYVTTPLLADYNTDQSIAVIRRMSLYEDDISPLQIVSACIVTQDGFRIHFGQFMFSTSQTFTVLTPSSKNRLYCLGMYQRTTNLAYTLYNDRSDNSPNNYGLYYGKIDYLNKIVYQIPIVNHDGNNNYYLGVFSHLGKFYYLGETQKIKTSSQYPYSQTVGMLNLFDQQDSFSCTSPSQIYSFSAGGVTSFTLDLIATANMGWITTGYTSGPNFATSSGKSFKPMTLSGGLYNLNLKEPISNNTFCPIQSSPTPATVNSPTITPSLLNYDPDASSYPPQNVPFTAFSVSRICPDEVYYYSTFLSDTSAPLPSFVTFDPSLNTYIFNINNPSHVGLYNIMLQGTIGNNKTSFAQFTVQVASPCLNIGITVPSLASTPTYDISDLVPLLIDLNWDVIAPPTPSCGPIFFVFTLLNATAGGVPDTSIFSIINQTSGVQQIKVWTQSIPAAKTWADIKIEGRLQGDLVHTEIFTIIITNKCAVTSIVPVNIDEQIYYHGRDPIDITFAWSETVGTCGPISYHALEFISYDLNSNSSLDTGVFFYPKPGGGNDSLRIYTWDEAKCGTYQVRVYGSLGVGGYKQTYIVFDLQVIKDPCSYYNYQTSFVDDLTLWINQTDQVALIPPFTMNDTNWVCNFTYQITTNLGAALDPIFVIKNVAKQGDGTNITLVTAIPSKVEISPQGIRVKGWPNRQNTTFLQMYFRIFVAYYDRTDCPSGKFYDLTEDSCLVCQSPCSTCKGSATQCTWCISGYTLLESSQSCTLTSTMPDCPVGTVRDLAIAGYCRKCGDYCASCTDYDTCTACQPGFNLANGKCYLNRFCPDGFRFDDALPGCLPCDSGCSKCSTSGSVCTYCLDGYYLDTATNTCVEDCPSGTYADFASKVCMVCSPACKTCVTNNYTCTSCNDLPGVQYYLFQSTCVTRCPYLQYYQNEANRSCDPCKPECKICVNAINDCIVCNPGSVISGRECLNSCPEGYYITVIGTCFQCDPACQKCYGSQNSMCTECIIGQYLTQTTCEPKCSPPLFADAPTKQCLSCPYYCNQCTMATNCQKCKTGYSQLPQDCLGEFFLKVSSAKAAVSAPLSATLVPDTFNPTGATVEFWFKADNAGSLYQEIIVGLSPYKIRKKSTGAQVQLNWGDINYCDSTNIKSDSWYHFAFAMSEDSGGSLNCYLNGELLNIGQSPVSAITNEIVKFKEITFGSSVDIKTSESKFNGHIKEFRWWQKTRSQFQINNFKNVYLSNIDESSFNPPNKLLAYWRLDEKKSDTVFKDSGTPGLTYDPLVTLGLAMNTIVEMREIYLKMCPEGTFIYFNETMGYYNCTPCHPDCQNCNDDKNTSCTSCVAPYKLLETKQTCIIVQDCPQGYWIDANKNCWPCHPYCSDCYGADQFQCTGCNSGFFKAYKRAGCVDSCPRGLYGNYLTQSCSANPLVTSLYPEDGLIFEYGSYIDLVATYQVLNDEPRNTYSYDWIISKLSTDINIAKDATKRYAGEDILRVHLDNNIIEPNNYYNITFYVKGDETVYNGMLGVMFNVIYIGIPPKGGVCSVNPPQGVATVTEFSFQTGSWKDPDGISEFKFLYSLDNGVTFVPVAQDSLQQSQMKYTFPSIYKTANAILKCQVKSLKGFVGSATVQFLLLKKSTSNSRTELYKVNMTNIASEQQSLQLANQLQQISSDLGSLKQPLQSYFDPKITPDQCTEELCSFAGQCQYVTFSKKYICNCYGERAGFNCTFKNKTDLELLKNLTLANAVVYTDKASGNFDTDYLKLVTQQPDIMTHDLFDKVHDIIYSKVLKYQSGILSSVSTFNTDYSEANEALEMASSMIAFLDQSNIRLNMTGKDQNLTKEDIDEQYNRISDNLNRTMRLIKIIQNATLYQVSFLQPQIQLTSQMISYKQVLTSKDQILSMPATSNIKKQQSSFVKISPANFVNSSVNLNNSFIAEAIEYSVNPFQLINSDRVAANILEINLYNQLKTVSTNEITKAKIENLQTPIELSFPVSDNQNMTDFLKDYNALSPFRYSERLKREQMIVKSGLKCVFWDTALQSWSNQGCHLASLDLTHVKCQCNHLSAFTITFTTPKLTIDAPLLDNSTSSAESAKDKTLLLEDIIKWPLEAYFINLLELWQHKRPSFLSFIVKPGGIVLGLFWAMYLSSLIYYSGRDDLKRNKMTKAQNREDLAELKDDEVQNLKKVVRDLIVRDFLHENGKFIMKEARRAKAPQLNKKQIQPPQIKIYEQMSKEDQKKYKKRARRKVFGVPAGLCDRAHRYYSRTMKHNSTNPNAKMSFFNEELKNNLWIGLIAKTSKIAPRHVRLLLMYFYAALYITILTIVFAFQIQEYISDNALFQVVALAILCQIGVWVITIPVACIFRMPMHLRKMVSGVRTKKVNKVFPEIDKHMSCRYAVGYFICLATFLMMTVLVFVFNLFYPQDYVIGWAFNIILIYIFDLVVFTFGLASIQMVNVIISAKVKCWYKVWAGIEVFRYLKNLRG